MDDKAKLTKNCRIKMTPEDYDRWMDLRKSLDMKTHLDLMKYLIDFYIEYKETQRKKEASEYISRLKSIIKLPSATMDHSSTIPDMNTLSAPIPSSLNTNVNCDIKNERLEAIDNNVNIKTEETNDFEENLSIQDKNTVNQIFATKEVVKIEDEDQEISYDSRDNDYDYIFHSDDDENIEEERDDDYIPTSPASYGDDEESDGEPPAKKHAMSNENSESVADENEQNEKEKEESINFPLLVYKDCLEEIANYVPLDRCDECSAKVKLSHELLGSRITLMWHCLRGHFIHKWHSQPKCGKAFLGDLVLSSAIILSRLEYEKMRRFFVSLHIPIVSASSFYKHKSRYVIPVINSTWEKNVKKDTGDAEENEKASEEAQGNCIDKENLTSKGNDNEYIDNSTNIDEDNDKISIDDSKVDKKSNCDKTKQKYLRTGRKKGRKTDDNKESNENLENSKDKGDLEDNGDNESSKTNKNSDDSQSNGNNEDYPSKEGNMNPQTDKENDPDSGSEEDSEEDSEESEDEDYEDESINPLLDNKDYAKKLDDIDYYYNKDREQKETKEGRKCWIRKKNKNTNHVSVYRSIREKEYKFIPNMIDDIVRSFNTKKTSLKP